LDVISQLIPLLTQGALIIDGDDPSNAPELPKKTKAKKKRSKEPLIVRIMQTREGLKLGISCLKHGSAKVFLYRFLLYINSSSITFSATIHWCFIWCWFIFVHFVVLVSLQIDYALHCTEYS
jgi:pumilio family protein 6